MSPLTLIRKNREERERKKRDRGEKKKRETKKGERERAREKSKDRILFPGFTASHEMKKKCIHRNTSLQMKRIKNHEKFASNHIKTFESGEQRVGREDRER